MARTKGKAGVLKKNEALQRLNIEYLPVDSISPNPYNPNRQSEHDFELLTRSMTEDGFTQPIVVAVMNEEHLADPKFSSYKLGQIVIVDGEHRWRCGTKLGYKEVPAVKVPMTVEQMRIATLRHNRARGSEDLELSAEVLRDLQQLGALDWAKDSLMLSDIELNKLLDDIPVPEALAADEYEEAWEPQERTVSADNETITNLHGDVALSYEANERVREVEQKIAQAKTEEEREMVRKESEVYRLILVFTGEQADLVNAILGDKPAEKLLELCRDASAKAA
jgi:ParB-like chromosome segregation protein Spo0J